DDVEFIEVANSDQSVTTYELDLVRIGTKEVKSAGAEKQNGLKRTQHRAAFESAHRRGMTRRAAQKARRAHKMRAQKARRAQKERAQKVFEALSFFGF